MKRTMSIALAVIIVVIIVGVYFLAIWKGSKEQFNTLGDVLVTDQFNNRVIEINTATNSIVWSFGSNDSSLCNPGNNSIIGVNYAERLANGLTLMAGTGTPANVSSAMPDGCADNRVIVVNKAGNIIWQYGQAGVAGNDTNELNVPVAAIQLPNGDFLITDQANNRVIEVNQTTKQIVWNYSDLNGPNSAELLDNGNILIADQSNNRAIEVTRAGDIVWQYNTSIDLAAFASRLPNGNTMIVDSGNARILVVSPTGNVVFQYYTNASVNSNQSPLPTNAVQLKDGNIIIADQFNHRVIIINPNTMQIVWQYGETNVSGNGPGQLYGPYTAFVIGDYTGQTVPPAQNGINSNS
jgi:hypothetical protein